MGSIQLLSNFVFEEFLGLGADEDRVQNTTAFAQRLKLGAVFLNGFI
jgi:hypothetical protein